MVTADAHMAQKSLLTSLKDVLGATNHKTIGKMYLVFALLNFALGGMFALMIRMELLFPGLDFVSGQEFGMLFTMHGTVMIFLAVFPLTAAFGNYLIPLFIGAKDLYWPRWNNIAFWMLIPGALFIWIGLPDVGWTGYVPLSGLSNPSVNMWIIGLLILGVSSIISSLNFIVTITLMRDRKITWKKLDLLTWSLYVTAFIQLLATPIISSALVMLLLDRAADASFFAFSQIDGILLWQHIFWAYSHPAVYIMVLPAMGMTSLLISKFSRNPIFGYSSMVVAILTIAVLGFLVWGHHMFTTGIVPNVLLGFTTMTYVIAVPSGIKTFNWVSTMYGGRIKFEAPMLFATGFIIGFILGGFTGVIVNVVPLDFVLHDTYFVVGHFHFIALGAIASSIFGMVYYLIPHATGKMYHKKMALYHFILWQIGYILAFGAMSIIGMLGNPRRYADYTGLPNEGLLQLFHQLASIGAFLMAIGVLLFVINLVLTVWKGQDAGDDPWGFGETKNDLLPPEPTH